MRIKARQCVPIMAEFIVGVDCASHPWSDGGRIRPAQDVENTVIAIAWNDRNDRQTISSRAWRCHYGTWVRYHQSVASLFQPGLRPKVQHLLVPVIRVHEGIGVGHVHQADSKSTEQEQDDQRHEQRDSTFIVFSI